MNGAPELWSGGTCGALLDFLPLWIGEDYRGFDLAVGYGPILFEQPVFFVGSYDLKAVSFVETNRPGCIRPRADQDGIVRHLAQVREQKRSDSLLLAGGAGIGVAEE